MAQVDPFIIPLPKKLAADPEVGPYFVYQGKFLHDLWKRTGAGADLVGDAVTDADLTSALAVHTASNDNTTQAELTAGLAASIAAHEAALNPHPGYLTPAEGDAAYQPLDGDSLIIDGTQVVSAQQAAVADAAAATATNPAAPTAYTAHASGAVAVTSNAATDLDTTAAALKTLRDEVASYETTISALIVDVASIRTQLNSALAKLRTHGLIDT
jgi:hypothetical protein